MRRPYRRARGGRGREGRGTYPPRPHRSQALSEEPLSDGSEAPGSPPTLAEVSGIRVANHLASMATEEAAPQQPSRERLEQEEEERQIRFDFASPISSFAPSTTAPHARSDYMAASRRSPLISDQWQGDDDDADHQHHHRYRHDAHHARQHRHRDPDYRARRPDNHARSRSPSRRAPADDHPSLSAQRRGSDLVDRHASRHHHADGHAEHSHRRPPPRSHSREEAAEVRRREPELDADRHHERRSRHRERSTGPESRRRHDDEHSETRHRSDHHSSRRDRHREYESRSHHHRRRSRERGAPRDDHDYPARPAVEDSHPYPSSQEHTVGGSTRGDVAPRHKHRGRSTSPAADQYSQHRYDDRHRHHSPRKSHHHRDEHRSSRHADEEAAPRTSRKELFPEYVREKRTREASPGPPRSSRHSERPRERTHPRDQTREYSSGWNEERSRSPHHRTRDRTMHSTRPIQSILDEQPRRPPSPPRPIPSFDDAGRSSADEQIREQFPMHGMKAADPHRRAPPHIDTRPPYSGSPPYGATPTSSQHGSPHSGSPYSSGRGNWAAPPQYMGHNQHVNAYSPPYRQNSYPPPNGHHNQYYNNSPHHGYQQPSPGYQSPAYRGGHFDHGSMRGGYPPQDRRFSGGTNAPPPPAGRGAIAPTRGRGGFFQNLHWNANGSNRGGKAPDSQPRNPPPMPPSGASATPKNTAEDEEENPFRPSKDFQVEDQGNKDAKDASGGFDKSEEGAGAQSKEASKFSFAFKAKPAPPPAAKPPVPDLTQKMKEPPAPPPPRKDVFQDSNRKRMPREELPPPRYRERRPDGWDDRRGDFREREHDHRRPHERWDYPERPDRRYDPRMSKDPRPPPREKLVEKRLVKKILKRPRDKPRLENEFKASDSIYFRKGGNESVIGSGTYGKVYKGIHVFTKGLVALKKIRMEGERDGFPITAVRELKLLQSLRHENVVGLLEVMVEKNDCFMVFEYLSHDLTGLLNHPTFQLEHAHKKDLARQMFQGLDYLHKRGVLHRDIKAANILVSNTGQLKLADFGLARFYAKRQQLDYTNRVITIWYRPPELLLGETQYGPPVDVWSAACVMVEIFTKHAIFPGDGGEINQLEKVYNILGTPNPKEWPNLVEMPWYELLRPTERKPNVFEEKYKSRLTPSAFELLISMLQFDPAKRPTASDVLEHPYFTVEEPLPRQAVELKDLVGDWHEFESKALRRENERREKEARRQQRQEEVDKDKAKRRASAATDAAAEREPKRPRPNAEGDVEMQ